MKKLLTLLTALVLLFSITACTVTENNSSEPSSSEPPVSSEVTSSEPSFDDSIKQQIFSIYKYVKSFYGSFETPLEFGNQVIWLIIGLRDSFSLSYETEDINDSDAKRLTFSLSEVKTRIKEIFNYDVEFYRTIYANPGFSDAEIICNVDEENNTITVTGFIQNVTIDLASDMPDYETVDGVIYTVNGPGGTLTLKKSEDKFIPVSFTGTYIPPKYSFNDLLELAVVSGYRLNGFYDSYESFTFAEILSNVYMAIENGTVNASKELLAYDIFNANYYKITVSEEELKDICKSLYGKDIVFEKGSYKGRYNKYWSCEYDEASSSYVFTESANDNGIFVEVAYRGESITMKSHTETTYIFETNISSYSKNKKFGVEASVTVNGDQFLVNYIKKLSEEDYGFA